MRIGFGAYTHVGRTQRWAVRDDMSCEDIGRMTVVDLTSWLEKQGIPQEFCDAFSGMLCLVCVGW